MKTLFIGDSITEGFEFDLFFKNHEISNHGISGVSSQELKDKMSKKWFETPYQQIFLCVGTNDLTRKIDHLTILENLKRIYLECLQLNNAHLKRFFFTSIFPIRDLIERDNHDIDMLNQKIFRQANDLGCYYLHLNPNFKALDDSLHTKYTDDGLHLNESGYTLWARLIEQLIFGV